MRICIKNDERKIKYLYHYTLKENVDNILMEKTIKSRDAYTFFTDSYEKSVELFESEMMSEHLYYDLDGILKKRKPAKKEDYKIIKIPYKNDGKFVKFIFNQDYSNSIYSKSVIHEGNIKFDKAYVLDFIDDNDFHDYSIVNKIKYAALSISFVFGLFMPMKVYADSWLDDGNYDISWYDGGQLTMTSLFTPEQFAGFNYITKNNIATFFNCNYNNPIYYPEQDIDLSAHDWVKFSGNSHCSCICGIHRVILRGGQKLGMDVCISSRDKLTYAYKHIVNAVSNIGGTISVNKNSVFEGDTLKIDVSTNKPGYYITNVFVGNKVIYSDLVSLDKKWNNSLSFDYKVPVMDSYKLSVSATFALRTYNFEVSLGDGVDLGTDIYDLNYGQDYNIPLIVDSSYRVTKIIINGEEYISDDNIIRLRNITEDYSIEVETEKIPPNMNNIDDEIVVDLRDREFILSNGVYELDDYAIDYLFKTYYFKKQKPFVGDYMIVTDNNGKKLFKMYEDNEIELLDVDSSDNFIFNINDDFLDYFKEFSTYDLLENYKKVRVIFSDKGYCDGRLSLVSARIKNKEIDDDINHNLIYNNKSIKYDVEFYKKDDKVEIELLVNNDSSFNYKFDISEFQNEYVNATIKYDNKENAVIKKGKTKVTIILSYKKEIENGKLVNGIYKNKIDTDLKLLDEKGNYYSLNNPKTNFNIFIIVIVICLLITSLIFRNNKKIKTIVIIALIVAPTLVYAECNKGIRLNININFNKNSLSEQYDNLKKEINNYCISNSTDVNTSFNYKDTSIEFESTAYNYANVKNYILFPGIGKIEVQIKAEVEYDSGTGDEKVIFKECYSNLKGNYDNYYVEYNVCPRLFEAMESIESSCLTKIINGDNFLEGK